MNTKEVFKKDVLDSNANRVGKVNDLEFTLPSGNISHLVVKTGPLKKRQVGLDLIYKSGDNIILNITREELAARKK